MVLDGLGLKGSCKEAWHGTRKIAYERLVVKVQPRCGRRPQHVGDASTTGESPRTAAAVEWSQPEPRKQVCVTEDRAREVTHILLGKPEINKYKTLNIELFIMLFILYLLQQKQCKQTKAEQKPF